MEPNYEAKLKFTMVTRNDELKYYEFKSTLVSQKSLTPVDPVSVKLLGFPLTSTPRELKGVLVIRDPYLLTDYYVLEKDNQPWVLARGFEYSFDSWLETCEGKTWDDIKEQFRSIFRSITRGLIALYDFEDETEQGHGNLVEGIGITEDHEAKLFGMVSTEFFATRKREDGRQLKTLMSRVREKVNVGIGEWPKDLEELYDQLERSPSWANHLLQWYLDISFFHKSEERIQYVGKLHDQVKYDKRFIFRDLEVEMVKYLKFNDWKNIVRSSNDEDLKGLAMKLNKGTLINTFGADLHQLIFFAIYIFEHHNKDVRTESEMRHLSTHSLQELERRLSTVFPDFFGALRHVIYIKYIVITKMAMFKRYMSVTTRARS